MPKTPHWTPVFFPIFHDIYMCVYIYIVSLVNSRFFLDYGMTTHLTTLLFQGISLPLDHRRSLHSALDFEGRSSISTTQTVARLSPVAVLEVSGGSLIRLAGYAAQSLQLRYQHQGDHTVA